jgi:hypothetical protein
MYKYFESVNLKRAGSPACAVIRREA